MFQFFFGKSLQPRGFAETLCGSPLYMAPKIMQLQKYDAKVIFTFSICKNPSIFLHNLLLLTSTKYAGRSLECLFHSPSTCDWSVYSSLSCYILLSQLMFQQFVFSFGTTSTMGSILQLDIFPMLINVPLPVSLLVLNLLPITTKELLLQIIML